MTTSRFDKLEECLAMAFSSQDIHEAIVELAQPVAEGYAKSLEMLVTAKAIQKIMQGVIDLIEDSAMDEYNKQDTKVVKCNFALVTSKELGTKYHFDKCGDPELSKLTSAKNVIALQEKDRMTFLKALKSKTVIVDENTGEAIEIYPPYKTSTTGLVISI